MKQFVTAVPLFTTDMSVEAYQLRYQDSSKLFGLSDDHTMLDGIMNSPGLDILNNVGIEPFTGGEPIFLPVNPYMLLSNFADSCQIPPNLLVPVLSKDMPLKEIYFQKCYELTKAGFRLAIPEFELTHLASLLYNMASFVLLNAKDPECLDNFKRIRNKYPKITVVFQNVDDMEMFKNLKEMSNCLYEGSFYNIPVDQTNNKVSPLRTNALRLLKIMGEENIDFDLDEVSDIIQKDAALSIALLKFINSPVIGISNKVTSIKNAIALLGQKETRKWTIACVTMYVAEDSPSELTRISLTRAKYTENLATAFEMGIHAPSLFLMGLFSLLDVILDKPMKEALEEVSVSDTIREALAFGKGEFVDVLDLVNAYEKADWKVVSRIMLLRNIDPHKLNQAFVDSLVWYRQLLDNLNTEDED
ncbi:MAG: HDOD domain-containing protein [Defluviitaleaceae bacterium]|nr:HDOD domain-containing protein [Defluviitaleaceae bacterium]